VDDDGRGGVGSGGQPALREEGEERAPRDGGADVVGAAAEEVAVGADGGGVQPQREPHPGQVHPRVAVHRDRHGIRWRRGRQATEVHGAERRAHGGRRCSPEERGAERDGERSGLCCRLFGKGKSRRVAARSDSGP